MTVTPVLASDLVRVSCLRCKKKKMLVRQLAMLFIYHATDLMSTSDVK
uniref:Uncharacterized protein n=1 Tax=Anguilla anguilla TaxID=7936 RepID=A0A0E9S0P1_ANGAN